MKILGYTLAALMLATTSPAFADQPNMDAALAALTQAKESLLKATADKGGHRAKAIKAVDQAIAEVQAGIAYAKKH